MKIVTVREAKSHLPELVAQACEGEEVVIAGNNKSAVRLSPVPKSAGRVAKPHTGRVQVDAKFFGPSLPDELGDW